MEIHNNNVGKFRGNILDFINKCNQNAQRNQNNSSTKSTIQDKILPNSEILSKEDPNMIIYKYPNTDIRFPKNVAENCKILLFFGENKEMFINSFINIYRDIVPDDNVRYKLVPSNSGKLFQIYDIKARTFKYNTRIICFPNFFENKKDFVKYETLNELCDLFIKNKMVKKLHYIFITLDEAKKIDKNELTFFYLFINLFSKEKIKDKIMVLYSTNKFNGSQNDNLKIINDIFTFEKDDLFLFEENYDSYFGSLFNPEFHYINNNVIYDKKSNEEYKKLLEKMAIIEKKIFQSKCEEINMNKVNLIKNMISSEDINIINQIKYELKDLDRKELILLFYFLINSSSKNNISKFIVFLFENINNSEKFTTSGITLVKDKCFQRNLILYSKMVFTFLEKVIFSNCDLDNNTLISVKNIFTSKLSLLNLSKNKLTDITMINKEAFSSIKNMDLSYNKISNINIFSTYKCNNLKILNLSNNEISDIKAFSNEDSSNFNKLEKLDLSYNKIRKLNKINIKSVREINLRDNDLSEGINEFLNDNVFNLNELTIEDYDNYLRFFYSDNCRINFDYKINNINKNGVLKTISFKGIKHLIINNFGNVDFLSNESLNNLIKLEFDRNPINDITVFNQIKFINIEKIDFGYAQITKGFNSLHIFKSIRAKSISLYTAYGNKYCCEIEFLKPCFKLYYIFDDLNFLKDSLLAECTNIKIAQYIFDDNANFFSFTAIKNSFPIFKKLKSNKLDINYKTSENRYECFSFFNYNIRLKFTFNDLNFLRDEIFNDINSIKISNGILDSNLNLSLKRFPLLTNIELENNKIQNVQIFNDIDEINKINEEREKYNKINNDKKSMINLKINSNKCNECLLGHLIGDKFDLNKIESINNNNIRLNYIKPFKFEILIDKNKLNAIKSFNQCETINITNFELSNNDLNFLSDATLFCLERLNLNLDENVNLNFLEKVASTRLRRVSLVKKLSENNFEYIQNNNFICYNIIIEMKEEDNNYLNISFSFENKYSLSFKYLYEVNKNLEILKNIKLDRIRELYLANLNIKNIDFLSNATLSSLKILDLDSNKIEDISIFTKEKVNFNLDRLCLKNNPIRKGLHVLSNNFFKRSIYMDINVTKNSNEFKINLNYKFPFYDIEFYVNNIDDLINIIKCNNIFIRLNSNNIEELKQIENTISANQCIDYNNKIIFEIILYILNLRNKYCDTLNIIYDKNSKEFGKDNNIYINDDNIILIEKAFKWILDKKSNYQETDYKLDNASNKWDNSFNNINLYNLDSRHEYIIINFPFTRIYNLTLYNCSFDLQIFQKTKFYDLNKIDLSQSQITNIQGLCGYVPFNSLKILNISNNKAIANLGELKEARFKDLEELYLSNDDIADLNNINFGEFGFYKLKILDLSHNLIQSLSPLKFYRNLKILNLEHNLINNNDELNYVIDLNNTCMLKLNGNNVSGAHLGYFRMI